MTYRTPPPPERPPSTPIRERLARSRYTRRIAAQFRTRQRVFLALALTPPLAALVFFLAQRPLEALTGIDASYWPICAFVTFGVGVMMTVLASATFYRCPSCGADFSSREGVDLAPRECPGCHLPLR